MFSSRPIVDRYAAVSHPEKPNDFKDTDDATMPSPLRGEIPLSLRFAKGP